MNESGFEIQNHTSDEVIINRDRESVTHTSPERPRSILIETRVHSYERVGTLQKTSRVRFQRARKEKHYNLQISVDKNNIF